jgi:hypothetical protein
MDAVVEASGLSLNGRGERSLSRKQQLKFVEALVKVHND